MAKMSWTKEQEQVIKTRNRNLLVSAAAGSGKTAVLVERLIRMVTDTENPMDIDRLLVMTFTNAAAAEMRERIGDALEKKLEENPGDRNLERQTMLIHHAKITTIDSFCLKLLREHFNELDIDPGFRIGDEGELMLIQADVMKEMLEDYYGRNEERFLRFADTYATGKADGGLEDYIMQVYRFAQSNPWPQEWIGRCREELEKTGADSETFETCNWMQFLLADVRRQAGEFAGQMAEALEIAMEENGPQAYVPMFQEDMKNMKQLSQAESYKEIHELLSRPLFGRLAAARGKDIDPEKKEAASGIRSQVKDAVKKMKALYVPGNLEHIFSDLSACQEPLLVLLELAEEFSVRFQAAKKEKNLVDFNDLEHFALEILMNEEHEPSPVADELANFYEEILVDEYQDSNEVQEALIRAVSRERFGTPNVFMVGDVKQSIYKFRLAKPKLFLDKYLSYSKEEGKYQKIELDKNFRSRAEVLKSVNDIFFTIMTEALGNIRYTEEAALHVGADYPEPLKENEMKTEVFLLNTGEEILSSMDEEKADYTSREAEARLIALKIKELTDPENGMKIWNGKTEQYEPLKKKDIVILLRSLSGWAEEFLSILSAEGIPAFAESRTGYFTATEVATVLNMLAILDNPMQDIPLVGVLHSPIGGFTDRELAVVMASFKKTADKGQDSGFYGAVTWYLAHRENMEETDEIYEKLNRFWILYTELRREAAYLPVHSLIYKIFERTGYYEYVSAMPAGNVRQANLDMLVEKAAAFEKTSYQSLYDFIRYIEKLKKYDTDFGEAARAGENEDTVRIMSIHKSKGLEFPVVFLAGAGKQFNRQDTRGRILIDEELGIATDYFDVEQKVKASTLKKNVLARRGNLENMGEELRILYVAMTRAREKLIITAGDKYLENHMEKWEKLAVSPTFGKGLPFTYLSAANSYLDWILMAAKSARDSVKISQVSVAELLKEEANGQAGKAETYLKLKVLRDSESEGGDFDAMLNFRYPYQADITLHAKMSVSELKHQGQYLDDAESDFLSSLPTVMQEMGEENENETTDEKGERHTRTFGGVNAGALRGTAYHRALELLRFKDISSQHDIYTQLNELVEAGKLDLKSRKMIRSEKLNRFFETDIAERMKKADTLGKLHKESQFIMGIPASQMDEADSEELVLIQGIIDVWFEEDGELVLVDYKTDRVEETRTLLDRYQLQLVYYAQALQQITKKRVKEAVIYSLTLQTEISVPVVLE